MLASEASNRFGWALFRVQPKLHMAVHIVLLALKSTMSSRNDLLQLKLHTCINMKKPRPQGWKSNTTSKIPMARSL